jgi:hypothetical protein
MIAAMLAIRVQQPISCPWPRLGLYLEILLRFFSPPWDLCLGVEACGIGLRVRRVFITSGLTGVAKILGSTVFPTGFPWRSKIFAVFFGGMVFHCYFPWGDCSDMYVICGGSRVLFLVVVLGSVVVLGVFSVPGMLPSIKM